MIILVGDIGGTHSRLAYYEYKDNRLTCLVDKAYQSTEHSGLEEIVLKFIAGHRERATLACFGVAGPVRNRRARITNLPWIVDSSSLEQRLGLARAMVINDLEAIAYSVGVLEPEDLAVHVIDGSGIEEQAADVPAQMAGW